MGTATTMLKTDPFAVLSLLGVPDGSLSTSSRSQLGQKLAIASTAVGKTAMKLYGVSAEELTAALPELGIECFLYFNESLALMIS